RLQLICGRLAAVPGTEGMPLNVNIGVLGHRQDTSLSKALSTQASTASFDKNPQSQERRITLDLAFSTFSEDSSATGSSWRRLPAELSERWGRRPNCSSHWLTVRTRIAYFRAGHRRCPDYRRGDAGLWDATKGIQTQTAECLVLAEIVCSCLLLVINKVATRSAMDRLSKRLLKTLPHESSPKLSRGSRGGQPVGSDAPTPPLARAYAALAKSRQAALVGPTAPVPTSKPAGPFLFAVTTAS
uniref:IMS_C domain-containing protein n=1 Tax=Macrostomum lignano TaxID=282301 RepID=A0A1I8FRM5_9PLAT